MSDVAFPDTAQLFVRWGCRRCGFSGGLAKTTFPVSQQWNEEMMRPLLDALRLKLVKKHQLHLFQKAGAYCLPSPDDFYFERHVAKRNEPQVMGLV